MVETSRSWPAERELAASRVLEGVLPTALAQQLSPPAGFEGSDTTTRPHPAVLASCLPNLPRGVRKKFETVLRQSKWPESSPYTRTVLGVAQVLERAAEMAYHDGDIEPIRDELSAIAEVCRPTGYAVTVVYDIATKVMHERARTARAYEVVGGRFGTREEVAAALNVVEQNPDPWWMDGYPVRWTAAVDQVMAVHRTRGAADRWARSVHVHSIERAALARSSSTPAVVRALPRIMVAIFAAMLMASLLVDPKLLWLLAGPGLGLITMMQQTGTDRSVRRVYGDPGPVHRVVSRTSRRRGIHPERNRMVLHAISEADSQAVESSTDRQVAVEAKPAPGPNSFIAVQVWARSARIDVKIYASATLADAADQLHEHFTGVATDPADRAFLDEDGVTWEIGLRDGREPLPQDKTLAELGIGDGSALNLVHGAAARSDASGASIDLDELVASGHRFLIMDRATFGLSLRGNSEVYTADFGVLTGGLEGEGAAAVADLLTCSGGRHVALLCGDTWRWSSAADFANVYQIEVLDALLRMSPRSASVVLTGPIAAITRMLAACGVEDRFTVVPSDVARGVTWPPEPVVEMVADPRTGSPDSGFRKPESSDPLYSQASETWLHAEAAWKANARLIDGMYGAVRDVTPIDNSDPNLVRDVIPVLAPDLAARAEVVRAGLQALDEAWLAYLVKPEEAFLTMPRLRDDEWPATKRYREAMAALGEAIEVADADPDEASVSAGEVALHNAEDAWHDARLSATDAGTASLPEREQRALRRAAHHIQVLEDPNLPKAMRDERLRQLRAELDRLDTVPISFEQVMEMPQLETVRRLALEAAPATDDTALRSEAPERLRHTGNKEG